MIHETGFNVVSVHEIHTNLTCLTHTFQTNQLGKMVSGSECFTTCTFHIYYTYRLQKYRNKLMALYQGRELWLHCYETTYYQNYQGMVLDGHPHCLGDKVFHDTPPPSCPVLRNLDCNHHQRCPVYRICNCLLSQPSAEGHRSPKRNIH